MSSGQVVSMFRLCASGIILPRSSRLRLSIRAFQPPHPQRIDPTLSNKNAARLIRKVVIPKVFVAEISYLGRLE